MMKDITISMTEEEAKTFVEYRKNFDTFNTLLLAGVFNVRNGKAMLNFDGNGTLSEVKCEVTTFKIGKPIIQFIEII